MNAEVDNINPSVTIETSDFPFANITYKLYERSGTSSEWTEKDPQIIHTTTDKGEFVLKYNQKAVFEEVAGASVSNISSGKVFDFDNFTVTEKSVPYMFGQKALFEEASNTSEPDNKDTKTITVTNFYRPVIYISKNTTGIPEGLNLNEEFSYKVKIKELTYDENGKVTGEKYLTKENLTEAYKILNKTTDTTYQSSPDSREDGALYWYAVSGSAGLYDTPAGWADYNPTPLGYCTEINKDNVTYDTDGTTEISNEGYYTVTFDAKTNKCVALPIYIQHKIDNEDQGMLVKIGNNYYPRYDFEIEEILTETSDWQVQSPENGKFNTDLNKEINSASYMNVYKYKDILLTKNVTNAHDSLQNYAFAFKLTKKSGDTEKPYYRYGSSSEQVTWQLYTQDKDGELTPVPDENNPKIFSGLINSDGAFVVPKCGNDSNSSENKFVVRIQGIAMGNTYTITELLKTEDQTELTAPSGYTLATTNDFTADKESDTQTVSARSLVTEMEINNDYRKRDLTIKKVVIPDCSDEKRFTLVLVPKTQPIPDAIPKYKIYKNDGTELTTGVSKTTFEGKNAYQFELGKNWSITFPEIDVYGTEYDLYEKIDGTYKPISLNYEDGKQYSNAEHIVLKKSDDYSFNMINGDKGYIVIRKEYAGDIGDNGYNITNETATFKCTVNSPIQAGETPTTTNQSLWIVGTSGNTYLENGSSLNNKTVSISSEGQNTVIDNICLKYGEYVIMNMEAIFGGMKSYTVEETTNGKQITQGNSIYRIEPEVNPLVCTGDDVQAIITNKVTKFGSPIYKRIGASLGKNAAEPSGNITFRLTNSDGTYAQGVRCIPAYISSNNMIPLNQVITSDENGLITLNYDSLKSSNNGSSTMWENGEIKSYYLMLQFDKNVKINQTNKAGISITEVTSRTASNWGIPVGYEMYGNTESCIVKGKLEAKEQWDAQNADTFVNTQETEPIDVTKWVNDYDLTAFDENNPEPEFTFNL